MTRRDDSNYANSQLPVVLAGTAEMKVLTTTARACTMKPKRLNLLSPPLASATPAEIMSTIKARRLLGSDMRNAHEMRRMATGLNA